jgi:hypothetical protein
MLYLVSCHLLAKVGSWAEALNDFFYWHAGVQEERRESETLDVRKVTFF